MSVYSYFTMSVPVAQKGCLHTLRPSDLNKPTPKSQELVSLEKKVRAVQERCEVSQPLSVRDEDRFEQFRHVLAGCQQFIQECNPSSAREDVCSANWQQRKTILAQELQKMCLVLACEETADANRDYMLLEVLATLLNAIHKIKVDDPNTWASCLEGVNGAVALIDCSPHKLESMVALCDPAMWCDYNERELQCLILLFRRAISIHREAAASPIDWEKIQQEQEEQREKILVSKIAELEVGLALEKRSKRKTGVEQNPQPVPGMTPVLRIAPVNDSLKVSDSWV